MPDAVDPDLLAVVQDALDNHQRDEWIEDYPGGRCVMKGDCSSTGDDGWEPHDEPFTLHQARWVVPAVVAWLANWFESTCPGPPDDAVCKDCRDVAQDIRRLGGVPQ